MNLKIIKSKLITFAYKLIRIEQEQQNLFRWPDNYLTRKKSARIASFIYREIYMLLLLFFAIPGVIIVRLLQPFLLIRFMRTSGKRIGHLAFEVELYLCERDAGMHKPNAHDIFYFSLPFSNHQLKKMWKKKVHLAWSSPFVHQIYRLNKLFPDWEKHTVPEFSGIRDLNGLLERIPSHLAFTPKEETKGLDSIRKMGIPEGMPFVCFHVRDSAYLKSSMGSDGYSYRFRDSDINNYMAALEELTGLGYFLVRMGAGVRDRLTITNTKIIDYARKYRTDFLDIYLCAKCKFFLSSNSGLDMVPQIFRRPVVYVNFVPFEVIHTWWPVELFIFKKYWLREEKRFMASREILDSGVRNFYKTEQFDSCGIELIENTSEEIKSVIFEMDMRLQGKWKEREEDKELQSRFWSLFKHSQLQGKINARVGAEFLRQNKELLE